MALLDLLGYLGQGVGQFAAGQARGELSAMDMLAERRAKKELMDLRRLQAQQEKEAAQARARAMEQDRALRAAAPLLEQFANPDLLATWERSGELGARAEQAAPILQGAGYPFDPAAVMRGAWAPGAPMPEGAASTIDMADPSANVPWQPQYRYQPSFKTQQGERRVDLYGQRVGQQGDESKAKVAKLNADVKRTLDSLPFDLAKKAAETLKIEGMTEYIAERTKSESELREPRKTLMGAQAEAAASTPGYRMGVLGLGAKKLDEARRSNQAREANDRARTALDARRTVLAELQAPLTRDATRANSLKLQAEAAKAGMSDADKRTWDFHMKRMTKTLKSASGMEIWAHGDEEQEQSRKALATLARKYGGDLETGGGEAPAPGPTSAGPAPSGGFSEAQINWAAQAIDKGTFANEIAGLSPEAKRRAKQAVAEVKRRRAARGKR